jgi:predicted metal-dependent peptidase
MAKSYELTEAMSRLISSQPFYAVLLMDLLTIEETDAVPTAATDGKKLFINPKFFKNELKDVEERIFVLAHEVLHVVFQHCPRLRLYNERGFGPDMKVFSPMRWNRATDYIINHTLDADKIGSLPVGGLYHPKFTGDMLADDVYVQLKDEDNDDQNSFDDHKEGDESTTPDDAKVKRALAGAATAAKAVGKLPASMKRMVDELLEPQIKWSEKLMMEISAKAGRDSSTWQRPNRRRISMPPHIYFPGTTGYQTGHICVYIDTSGSIGEDELKHFLSETAGILQEATPELLQVGSCDTKAYPPHTMEEVCDIEEYQPEGGGGTYLPDIYRVLDEEAITPDVLIILTDGYTQWDKPPAYPVIVVSTTKKECPYGQTFHMTMD